MSAVFSRRPWGRNRELKNHDDDFVDDDPFSSPEPLGLICNRQVALDWSLAEKKMPAQKEEKIKPTAHRISLPVHVLAALLGALL